MDITNLKNLDKLDTDAQIFFTLIATADKFGNVRITPAELARYVKKPIKRIFTRLEAFEKSGILFYNAEIIQFNPTFYRTLNTPAI